MLYSKRGFTFIEAFISIAIIAVTAILVITLFSYMTKVSLKGSEMTIGSSLCSKIINTIASDNDSDLKKNMIEKQSSGFSICGSEACGDKTYYYIAETVPVYSSSAFSGMVKVTCVVFWFADSAPFEISDFSSDNISTSSIDQFLENSKVKFQRAEFGFSYMKLSKMACVSEN